MSPKSIAIVGGGPGGLMTSHLLQQHATGLRVSLYEAGASLGGKVLTKQFATAPVCYEAGAAELYDYSALGPDPLRELVDELELDTFPMRGETVILDGHVLRSDADIRRAYGDETVRELMRFARRARAAISPAEYYESDWRADNQDPLTRASFRALLDRVEDRNARRYIEVALHSDLATEPHRTSAAYGLQNWLMNEEPYMTLYGIRGGNQRLTSELARRLTVDVRMRHRVTQVQPVPGGRFRVTSETPESTVHEIHDCVVVSLPVNWLRAIRWKDDRLDEALARHHRYYDHPANYLRVSALFRTPFWRRHVADSYFMHDAFGGCCIYDESGRTESGAYGVLGWLIAGEAAATLSNCTDDAVLQTVLDSWPGQLGDVREEFLEGQVHRWIGSVNALPGGRAAVDPEIRHRPEPVAFPNLYLVGDYLFDSTLNGVMDSAEWVVESILEQLAPANAVAAVPEPQLTLN